VNEPFTGGPLRLFTPAGREQLVALLAHGLESSSTVADIGCGALRGGRWLIPLLDPGHYCGVEPNKEMLQRGLRDYLDPDLVLLKRPQFSYNDRFDLSEFGVQFTHVMLRSVWTHSAKSQIESCLDSIATFGTSDVVALASLVPRVTSWRRPWRLRSDYKGMQWVGRSHESDQPGLVWHSMGWLRSACAQRGLVVRPWLRKPVGDQYWVRVTRRQPRGSA
jgi:hypothetical protein